MTTSVVNGSVRSYPESDAETYLKLARYLRLAAISKTRRHTRYPEITASIPESTSLSAKLVGSKPEVIVRRVEYTHLSVGELQSLSKSNGGNGDAGYVGLMAGSLLNIRGDGVTTERERREDEDKIKPQTVKQESEEEHKIERGDDADEGKNAKSFRDRNRVTGLEAELAEQKMEQWLLRYPELRLKWVAVRDGEPSCPADNPYAVARAYEKQYGEHPRYMIQIGTVKERSVEAPIRRSLE